MPTALPRRNKDRDQNYTARSGSGSGGNSDGRPQLPKIATFDDDDDNGIEHPIRFGGRYPSFRAAAELVGDDDAEPLLLSPHMLDVDHSHPLAIKSASAPDASDAFPAYLRLEEDSVEDNFVASPAQMFLSAFSPPTATSKSEMPDADGLEVAGYTLSSTIGYGGFSVIKKAFNSTGDVVAIKVVKRADVERQNDPEETRRLIESELEIWSTLKHEHIMPLFSSVRTLSADYFVTLFCPAGSLFDILSRDGRPALPQDDAGTMFRQIVRGLRYMHEVAKLVHGDLKLENVFVDEMGSCRIGDFGLSKRIHETTLDGDYQCECESKSDSFVDSDEESSQPIRGARRRNTEFVSHFSRPALHLSLRRSRGPSRHRNSTPFPANSNGNTPSPQQILPQFPAGSLPYASPELLSPHITPLNSINCKIHGVSYAPNPAQDMWALGVLLYALLTGRLPFSDSYEPRLQMKILHGAYDVPVGIGHGAESVLRGCLEQAVSLRWNISMVDDIAWGVGWGLAGDVSGHSSTSPVENEHPGVQYYADEYRRERSRSRVRPYPDAHEHNVHHGFYHPHPRYPSESALSCSSESSSSKSRSCSRSTRRVSRERDRSSSRTSSFRGSIISEDVVDSSALLSQMLPPPVLPMRRGRRSRKSTVEAAHLSLASSLSPPIAPVLSGTSRSYSRSRSRSASPVDAPTTPPDTVPRPFSFPFSRVGSGAVDCPAGAKTRSSGPQTSSRAKSTKMDGEERKGKHLDVVEEGEAESLSGRWSPSSVLNVQALSLQQD